MSDLAKERDGKLGDAFIEGGETELTPELKLRPFTFGTLNLCRKMGLTQFTASTEAEKAAVTELGDAERQRQMSAFVWAQSREPREVLKHVREGTWEAEVELFEHELPVHILPKLVREIERISKLAADAAVEVAPKPSSEGDPDKDAPPNS